MDIYREPSTEEQKNLKYTPILGRQAKKTPYEKFVKRVAAEEQEYLKLHKPFCSRCAKIDFKNRIEAQVKSMEEQAGFAEFDRIEIPTPNFAEYADPEHFEFIKESDAMEPVGKIDAGGITRQIKIGIHRDFRCKKRGGNISVFLSNEDLEKEMSQMRNSKQEKTKSN